MPGTTPLEPVVKLYDGTTNEEYDGTNIINFGEVKAGDKSDVKTLHLWNNRGGAELASKMRDVEMFGLDEGLATTQLIIANGWLKATCTSVPGDETKLDADARVQLTAAGQDAGEILGSTNDGENTNTGNFASFELFAQLEGDDIVNAPHGPHTFYIAIRYFFT